MKSHIQSLCDIPEVHNDYSRANLMNLEELAEVHMSALEVLKQPNNTRSLEKNIRKSRNTNI